MQSTATPALVPSRRVAPAGKAVSTPLLGTPSIPIRVQSLSSCLQECNSQTITDVFSSVRIKPSAVRLQESRKAPNTAPKLIPPLSCTAGETTENVPAFPKLSVGHHRWKNSYKSCSQDRKGLTITPEPAVLPGAPAPHGPRSALGQGLSRLAPAQPGNKARRGGMNRQGMSRRSRV